MIRFPITAPELQQRITNHDPTWYQRAIDLQRLLPAAPTSKQFVSLWTDIKPVFVKLQNSKCIYCETLLEGAISNDIEHFRPKVKVSKWTVPRWLAKAGVQVTPPVGPKGDPGYRDLAYCPWNYGASCKFCNTVLKKNYFPINGVRQPAGQDPAAMNQEQALLVYPIGNIDDDPEQLLGFKGMHPAPLAAVGTFAYLRTLVIIELFSLNDAAKRKELFRARAELIGHLYSQLRHEASAATAADLQDAREWIAVLTEPKSPHASCLRCFEQTFRRDPGEAAQLVADAKSFLKTGSLATGN